VIGITPLLLFDAILRDESGCLQFPQANPAYGVEMSGARAACIIGKHGIESCLVLPRVEQCRLEASAIKLNEAYQTAFEM